MWQSVRGWVSRVSKQPSPSKQRSYLGSARLGSARLGPARPGSARLGHCSRLLAYGSARLRSSADQRTRESPEPPLFTGTNPAHPARHMVRQTGSQAKNEVNGDGTHFERPTSDGGRVPARYGHTSSDKGGAVMGLELRPLGTMASMV